ncbi:MAG: DNA primase [Vampirovibrionia bacterium]|jgi:DNA primase
MSSPINEIKEKADIVELIADHIPVKRAGASYVAKCPFHNDTKPSMHISSQKGIYKCFACGAGGDVFKFWSEYHNKDFSETLKDLALKYGVTLNQHPENIGKQKLQNEYLEIYSVTADYYHEKLLGAESAELCRNYLSERQIDLNTIKNFKIGYSPTSKDDWGFLVKHLTGKLKISEEEIFKSGLAIHHEKSGKYYDRFRDRLMIPITNEKDEVIGFGARILEDKADAPKYINSPETDIYHKGDELFGLSLAKKAIKEKDFVILVEGYFDQIALYKDGFKNTVANQGTALTPKQAKLLLKYSSSKSIYLCLDSDKAGELAKERAFKVIMQIAAELNPEIKVIDLQTAKDPDDFIKLFGSPNLELEIKNAKSFIDYKTDKLISEFKKEEFGPREKANFISKMSRFLYFINNKIELNAYIQKLAARLDLSSSILEEQIRKEFKNLAREFAVTGTNSSNNSTPFINHSKPTEANTQQSFTTQNQNHKKHSSINLDPLSRFDIELLAIMLDDRRLLEEFMANEYSLNKEEHQIILSALVDVSFENPDDDTNSKFKKLKNHESLEDLKYSSDLAEIAMELESDKKQYLTRFNEIISVLRKQKSEILKRKLDKELQEAEKNKDEESTRRLLREIQQLLKEYS